MDDIKKLKSRYKCVVNPKKLKCWDADRGKYIYYNRRHLHPDQKCWPVFGFLCKICNVADNELKHYLVDGISMCEKCALKWLAENHNKKFNKDGLEVYAES